MRHCTEQSWSNLGTKTAISPDADHRPAFFNRLHHYPRSVITSALRGCSDQRDRQASHERSSLLKNAPVVERMPVLLLTRCAEGLADHDGP
jgi:hypothetical protein